jgi:transcriptional regulator with XRE-family HTH domain
MATTQELSYGRLLKRIRLTKRDKDGRPQPWTQYEVHRLSGVAESEISEIEREKRNPQDGTKVKLATALDAPELMPAGL